MNSEQVANILAFYSYYHPKETIDDIGLDFKIPAALIVNGLHYGEKNGLFKTNRVGPLFKELTVTECPADDADYGKDVERIKAMIMELIANLNDDKEDILDDNLFVWIGAPLTISKVCLQLLVNEGKLRTYWIRDLKDVKSKYHYHTLPENVEKKFASKNFKHQGKKGSRNEQLPRRKR